MTKAKPKLAIIMTGGGARAAYQVGVLKAIGECLKKGAPSPFTIICGTSAGAINAAGLAARAVSLQFPGKDRRRDCGPRSVSRLHG